MARRPLCWEPLPHCTPWKREGTGKANQKAGNLPLLRCPSNTLGLASHEVPGSQT